MSVGGNRSPYRPPCGYSADEPEFYWLGVPWQHYATDDDSITRYQNTTVVANYADPSGMGYTATIPPYMRPNPAYYDCATSVGVPSYEALCGPWPDPPYEGYTGNTYAAYSPGETVNLATCRKLGYKIVFARKAWHGMFPFSGSGDDSGCCAGTQPAVLDSPPLTKYLTMTVTTSDTTVYYSDDTTILGTDIFSSTWESSVNRYSGVVTNTMTGSCQILTGDPDPGDYGPYTAPCYGNAEGLCNLGYCNGVWTGGNGGGLGEDEELGANIVADLNAGNLDGASNTSTMDITINVASPTEISIKCVTNMTAVPLPNPQETITVDIVLSNPYTSDDVNTDTNTLLAYWDLSDDAQYPWRTDANCTSGPFLSYDEAGATGPMYPDFSGASNYDTMPGGPGTYTVDGNTVNSSYTETIGTNTGNVLGAPNTPGCDPWFDFNFEVWQTEIVDGIGCYGIAGWGGSAPSWAPYATQWTNVLDAACLLPCAFAAYNSLSVNLSPVCGIDGASIYSAGNLIKSKYAEVILLTAPSHDFARPCGPKDAVTIDQSTVGSCQTLDMPTGSLLFPDCANPCPVPPASGGEWNDNFPKGDWCLVTWTFNYRDSASRAVTGAWSGITVDQQCSHFVTCCPAVVYLSNDGESSANSQTFTLTNLALDECYGSLWQMAPMQWMTDPLYQPPVPPCTVTDVEGYAWLEDDGTGIADGTPNSNDYYYAQRPWEECRSTVPSGAPALPTGYYLGPISIADINSNGSFAVAVGADYGSAAQYTANILGNPYQPPQQGSCWMPWWTWAINRQNTVTSGGRWHCDYADPLAVCDDDIELEPP